MFEWAQSMIMDVTTLVQSGVVLLAIITVVMVYGRTKQLIATGVAALLAGGVIWAVNNIDWFERKVGDETIAAVVVPAEVAAGHLDGGVSG